ncbi:MAG: GNAT family N-acetyltransferase [Rhodospirillales bacterium]|nr:GNAT family N-acetyltransferase [Rhodospirillales bacterium]
MSGGLRLLINASGQQEWDGLLAGYRDLSLMQCWAYGEAKARTASWRVERGVVLDGDRPTGLFQALVRPLPIIAGGLAWINRGPLWRPHDGGADSARLVAMLGAIARHYRQRGLYVRIAPAAPEQSFPRDGLREAGLADAGTPGWASARVDLSQPVDAIRGRLEQKWRNSLAKAERTGLDVRSGTDDALFRAFLAAHARHLEERKFETTVTVPFLETLQSLLPEDRKLVALVAYREEQPVASVLLASYGGTAEYLAGSVSPEGRPINAGQLLLWRAVQHAKERGFRTFDAGGLDADLTPKGIYHFKTGLGGAPYRLCPEIESADSGLVQRLVRWRVQRARAASQPASS